MSSATQEPAALPSTMTPSAELRRLRTRSFTLGALVGAGGAALILSAFLLHKPKPGACPPPYTATKSEVALRSGVPQPIPFETAQVKSGPMLPLPPMTARVAAIESKTAPTYAPVDGRIDHVVVRVGEHVKEGEHLALIRSGDLAGLVKELRASAAHAQTKRALAERMKLLVEARGASANDLLVAQNDLRDAELAARAADSRMKSLSISSEADNMYWLLAPKEGVVIQIEAAPGQQVGPGKERPVATIANLDEVMVLADVPQQDVGRLEVLDPVEIRGAGDESALGNGQIETISRVVDPERQTVPIRVRAKNPDAKLRPNAFVEARFGASGSKARNTVLRVPTDAVVSDGLRSVVFVQTSSGRFKRTEVAVGRDQGGSTEIRSGLSAGDEVVTRGALLLLNALDVQE